MKPGSSAVIVGENCEGPGVLTQNAIISQIIEAAKGQLDEIRRLPDSPFRRKPRLGHARGIDFYEPAKLLPVVAMALLKFYVAHKVLPNLVHPRTFNEKLTWSKFFSELKVPESGNKLLTHTFIPAGLRGEVRTAPVLWHAPSSVLPGNDEIAPGTYYFKSNHGSGMFERIAYPLSEEDRARLEATGSEWLTKPFGLQDGEWWYSIFRKELLLEDEIVMLGSTMSWNFYVFAGEVAFIAVYRKSETGEESTWLDPDFKLLSHQNPKRPRVNFSNLPEAVKERMKIYAGEIGRTIPFVRVDFMVGLDETIYLGEMTFTPGNGLTPRPSDINLSLGEKWRHV